MKLEPFEVCGRKDCKYRHEEFGICEGANPKRKNAFVCDFADEISVCECELCTGIKEKYWGIMKHDK